ncbi:MAG: hypothetical protein DWH79_06875 [Planctomycetota bacterium]|nr:MAG: hypothetical protein DWH79_06875 [Planctomycetota bacterium]
MQRAVGIITGVATHALFASTVWHLFWFLKGLPPRTAPWSGVSVAGALWIDAALATLFAVPHSVFLLPAVRRRIIAAGLPSPFYGCFFAVVSCLTLLVAILAWQPVGSVAWRWPAPLDTVIAWAFVASWVALFSSLSLTGLGWQTGWTPWWHWFRGLPQPRREFVERGAYRFLRHPVYLSFLGLVWFVPVVTLDRAVLIVVWSAYIYVGSVLKDRRLAYFLGDRYRAYQSRVPGYPGMPSGPLARVLRAELAHFERVPTGPAAAPP